MSDIVNDYKSGKLILFVGSGVSANLGLPTWSGLIDQIAVELGFDPEIFKTYGDNLPLAEYYILKEGRIGRLRSWMDREWHKSSVSIGTSRIHELIAKGKFHSIYTTNYDDWIERAFEHWGREYNKVVNVADLTKSDSKKMEIIKFHGDFSDDQSIVLSETSYFERLQFETPLDIKLRSDVLGKSVLFIGYSLSDINIRHLFYRLSGLWRDHGNEIARPKSYLFTSAENPVQKEILKRWGIETISGEYDDKRQALEDFLTKLTQ